MIKMDNVDIGVWEQHNRIIDICKDIQTSFIALGMELLDFDEKEGWRGFDHPSFNSYLADPEVPISIGTGYRARDVYQFFVVRYSFANPLLTKVGITKLDILRAKLFHKNLTRESVETWLNAASTNTQTDLELLLIDSFGGEMFMDHDTRDSVENGSLGGATRFALSDLLARHLELCPDDDHPSVDKARRILESD